jgi:hydrogenase maturation protease
VIPDDSADEVAEGSEKVGARESLSSSPAPACVSATTLVLGLGNPILGDDGVGWRVVEEARRRWGGEGVQFDCVALGGLALMERLTGYDRAILVDAIRTEGGVTGAIHRLTVDDLPTMHANAVHDASLKTALALGRSLGAELPDDILIVAVEAEVSLDFGETLSPAVEAAVPAAADLVLAALNPLEIRFPDEGGMNGFT